MALHIYKGAGKTNMLSENGSMTNPDYITGSGTDGFTDIIDLYVGNDSTVKRYTNVTVSTVSDDTNVDVKYSTDGGATWLDTITLSDVEASGNASGYDSRIYKRKITVASGQASQNRTNIQHKITAVEYAV